MATLDLEGSDIDSEYSNGFELEDLSDSQRSSEDESKMAVVAQLQNSLAQDKKSSNSSSQSPVPQVSGRSDQVKSKQTSNDLGKTVTGSAVSTKSSQKFNSSVDVRDACYSEWLSQKRSSISLGQDTKVKSLEEEERKKKLKEKEMEERGKKALERWNESKAQEFKKKQKAKQEITKEKKQKEEEREQKRLAAIAASEKWRTENTRDLIKKHRELTKKHKEEIKKKKEEEAEKLEEAAHAFSAWKSKKDSLIKERRKKEVKEKHSLEQKDKQQKGERLDDSKKAFEAWKSTKDEKLKTTKTLYTYQNQPKIHTQAWRPARSMKYDYPKDPKAKKKSPKKPDRTLSKTPSVDSYQSASFESSDSASTYSIEGSFVESENESPKRVGITGKRKTIQVCCQTLEYWCTCDSDNPS